MGLSVVVIANDFSAINVALPTMEKDFETDVNTIQWVVNAYALTFGVLIVTGGRLADMFGRRNAFFLGSAIFASMSALGGAAQTETWLIAARVPMGIGGALMWPAILGMTGVGMLPFLGTFGLVSFIAGPLYNRLGAKVLAVFGAACITVAPFLFSQVGGDSDFGSLVPGMLVLGIGIGSLTTRVFSTAVPPFVDGIQAGFRLDAALSLVGLLVAIAFVGGRVVGAREPVHESA
jgi:fucose permease